MKPAAKPSAGRGHEVRIVGGLWKRSKLPVPDVPGLRPTPDRVRETLFNWLGQDLSGWQVLDAFAGSGALGMEAGSRGASVQMLESDRHVVRGLQASIVRLHGQERVRIDQADAFRWMKACTETPFDLIFLDPPFALQCEDKAIRCAWPCLRVGGFLYLESGRELSLPPELGAQPFRQGRAGAVHFGLWRKEELVGERPAGQAGLT